MQTMRDAIGLGSQTNGTQIQSATIGNINPAQVQAQQIQDSNVNVFAEGIKGLQQTAGAIYEGVQDRKKLVALDASTQYNVGMQHIDKYYSDIEATGKALTSKDISSRMEWKQKFHSDMVGRTVDGVVSENYNKDFDDEIVKKGFIEPAVGYLNKSYSADAKQFQELDKLEYISTVKNQAAILGSDVTSSSVKTWISRLTNKGVQYPEALVYGLVRDNFNVIYDEKFKDGVLSTSIKPYIKDGTFSEDDKDNLFNSIYTGRFLKREKGVYIKLDKKLTDADEKAMIKGFASYTNALDSQLKEPIISTVPQSVGSIDLPQVSSNEQKTVLTAIEKQMYNNATKYGTRYTGSKQYATDNISRVKLNGRIHATESIEINTTAMVAKFNTNNFEGSWDLAVNNSSNFIYSEDVEGTPIATTMTTSEAESKIIHQLLLHDNDLRTATYDEVSKQSLNPTSVARLEIQSSGTYKSGYFKELSIGVKTGIIKADSSSQFMSEYNKYIDYAKENLSISDTWLADEVVRGEVDITMVTISNQIKNNEISETDGLAKMKMSFDALQNISDNNKLTYKNLPAESLKALTSLDADAIAEYGWLKMDFGVEVFVTGSQKLGLNYVSRGNIKSEDLDDLKDKYVKNFTPIGAGFFGSAFGYDKSQMIFTGGHNVNTEVASKLILSTIKDDTIWGAKPSSLSSSMLSLTQSKDDDGNIILFAKLNPTEADIPERVYTFTMSELITGKLAKKKGK